MRQRFSTDMEAWCAACRTMHPKSSFGRDKNMADGMARTCKLIVSHQNKRYHAANALRLNGGHRSARRLRKKSPDAKLWAIKKLLADARRRSLKRGFDFDLTPECLAVPDHCPLLGLPLIYQADGQRLPNSASLDRRDSDKGYTQGNCWIISWRSNQIKSDATPDELRRIADALGATLDGREWQEFPKETACPA